MENKERQIKDLKKKIELAGSAVTVHYEHIGEIAFSQNAEKKESSTIGGILNEMAGIDNEINKERERINNILNTVERSDEIEALRKSLNQKIRSIEKDNISNYETIGRASYEAFKDGELPEDKYADIFAEIVKLMLKIENAETEKASIEEGAADYGFLGKVKAGARGLYLKNTVSDYYNTLQRHYKKAGEKICHTDLVMNLEAESVKNAVKPVKANLEGIEKLEKEEEKLTSETEMLQGNLENLGVKNSAVRTVNEIEAAINELYLKRREKQKEAGEVLFLNKKDELAKIAEIKNIFKDINRENDGIQACRNDIQRLEADIEIERQNREINALNKKINGYEEKISNYNQEAEQLKAKIQQVEKNIKKLEIKTADAEGVDE